MRKECNTSRTCALSWRRGEHNTAHTSTTYVVAAGPGYSCGRSSSCTCKETSTRRACSGSTGNPLDRRSVCVRVYAEKKVKE